MDRGPARVVHPVAERGIPAVSLIMPTQQIPLKSALLAAIFGITGAVPILRAVPAEDKLRLLKSSRQSRGRTMESRWYSQIEELPPETGII